MTSLSAQTPAPMLAIIGGTGIESLEGFEQRDSLIPETPFGAISGALLLGRLHGVEVALINRHGLLLADQNTQQLPPHAVNYRANIWALAQLGVKQVLALNAVGGISGEWPPGRLGTPHDLIDYSSGREHSFFDPNSPMPYAHHVELTPPFNANLRGLLKQAALAADLAFTETGVLAVTNGPRLETVAEVLRLERDGCQLVGMTTMPEASLAAELELSYTSLAFSVNWAAGKAPCDGGDGSRPGIHDEIASTIASCQQQLSKLFSKLFSKLLPLSCLN